MTDKKILSLYKNIPKDYYDRGGVFRLTYWFWHRAKMNLICSLIETLPKKSKVLDVGCNSGTQTFRLLKKYPSSRFVGVDFLKTAIKYGQSKYPEIEFVLADAGQLPFKNSSFDLVLCLETLEHLVDPGEALAEMKRCLARNGYLIIELDSGSWLFNLLWAIWLKMEGKVWQKTHLWQSSPKILERLFSEHSLILVKKKWFNLHMGVVYLLKKS